MGLRGKVLVARGYRCAFCGKLLEPFPMSDRARPLSSKMDPLLARAESISEGSSTSVTTYLRKSKKTCAKAAAVRNEE